MEVPVIIRSWVGAGLPDSRQSLKSTNAPFVLRVSKDERGVTQLERNRLGEVFYGESWRIVGSRCIVKQFLYCLIGHTFCHALFRIE